MPRMTEYNEIEGTTGCSEFSTCGLLHRVWFEKEENNYSAARISNSEGTALQTSSHTRSSQMESVLQPDLLKTMTQIKVCFYGRG
ncbi:unnamed protein product [Protopolystoma xenopodis]|uniref:Uncharacterized protein n=1 Tax=Protopolystoma xenopodis TaxID=117903 RepID=A0A3S5AQU2_9PLAT|nr:unnamed protein product [Protopolystoma xenopodis]